MKINKYLVIILILLSCKKAANLTNTSTGNPLATDTIGRSIHFLGMTIEGGLIDSGTIFKINGDGSGYANVFSFSSASGCAPLNGSFCKAPNGKLYGETDRGGLYNSGTIFSFDPGTNTFKKLFDIANVSSGPFYPMEGSNASSLLLASDNNIYGTTLNTLFKIDPANDNISTVHIFGYAAAADGGAPFGGRLVQGKDNKLYGMCSSGGEAVSGYIGSGTIFSFDLLNSDYNVIYRFDLGGTNAVAPYGDLYQASDNNLYGFSDYGSGNSSSLFKINITGTDFAVVKIFDSININPSYCPGVTQMNNDKLYGLLDNYNSGSNSGSELFSYDLGSNSYLIEHTFSLTDGSPEGTLTKASNNLLYGVTDGGSNANGAIFRFDPASSSYKIIFSFPAILAQGGVYPMNLTEY